MLILGFVMNDVGVRAMAGKEILFRGRSYE